MAAWLEHAACQLQAVEQVFFLQSVSIFHITEPTIQIIPCMIKQNKGCATLAATCIYCCCAMLDVTAYIAMQPLHYGQIFHAPCNKGCETLHAPAYIAMRSDKLHPNGLPPSIWRSGPLLPYFLPPSSCNEISSSSLDTQDLLQFSIAFWISHTAKTLLTGNMVRVSFILRGSTKTMLQVFFFSFENLLVLAVKKLARVDNLVHPFGKILLVSLHEQVILEVLFTRVDNCLLGAIADVIPYGLTQSVFNDTCGTDLLYPSFCFVLFFEGREFKRIPSPIKRRGNTRNISATINPLRKHVRPACKNLCKVAAGGLRNQSKQSKVCSGLFLAEQINFYFCQPK
ncbi:hypothetical protein VP01_1875g2 [Puccinia sorghi]|uniref:Uncharacterized protein n=1 Tax=Puccinia sorghi TaxID=27349 RepID=A0A0L6VDP7_9BASI|nr:hypothetical protein VP01_1875g2 [Puccinia sorghi]